MGGGGVDNLSLGWRGKGANIKNINKPWKGGRGMYFVRHMEGKF